MIRSFRTRLLVVFLGLAEIALLAFALPAWLLLARESRQRLEARLATEAHRLLQDPQPVEAWAWFDERERRRVGMGDDQSLALLVRGRDGEELFRSFNWPASVTAGDLPLPAEPPLAEGSPFPSGEGSESPRGPQAPPRAQGRTFARRPPPPPRPGDPQVFFQRRVGKERWWFAALPGPRRLVVVGAPFAAHTPTLRYLRNAFLIAFPLVSLLIVAGAVVVSNRALRPVNSLTELAEGVTARGLDQRLPLEREDAEFVRLRAVFNEMLCRLERSYQQAIRFSADAAHELKTPLAVLQGELETAIQRADLGEEEQQTYGELLEEVQHLKTIVSKLLLLSMADAGRLTLHLTPVDFSALLAGVVEDAEILAPHLEIRSASAEDLWVKGDEELLGHIVSNLTSNAVKYNQPDGWIEYRLTGTPTEVMLTVTNPGSAIPSEDRQRVFDRFYRVDKARSRELQGVGLGLSLAREIARTHEGELELLEAATAGLTSFRLTLPRYRRDTEENRFGGERGLPDGEGLQC